MITANHWGRMEFRLCPQDATTADYMQRCTILQREDGKGPHWTLPPGELPDPQGRPLIPTFQDNSFTWYVWCALCVLRLHLHRLALLNASGCLVTRN